MTQETLENTFAHNLETVQLFEQCFYPGFQGAWQILPMLQAYQGMREQQRRERQKARIDAVHQTIHRVYDALPYERLAGKQVFAPVFVFKDELIPALDVLVEQVMMNPTANIELPRESLRLHVIEQCKMFFYNLRASVITLQQHPGYEAYEPRGCVAGKRFILSDKYLIAP